MSAEQHRRVLVVETDHALRDRFAAHLRRHGLIVDEAANHCGAVNLLRENAYAVVMFDVAHDGQALLDEVGCTSRALSVVLVITATGRRGIARFDARKIHGIVKKPFDVEEVAEVVAACAEVHGRSARDTALSPGWSASATDGAILHSR